MSRFTRTSLTAFAAVAAISTFAFTASDASARPSGMRMGGGHVSSVRHVGSIGMRHIRPIRVVTLRPHRPHIHWRFAHRRWIVPVATGVVTTGVAASVVTAPTWNRCNCLTKEYTPEGAVVFKDLCTQETAMNPPATAPLAGDPNLNLTAQASALPQQVVVAPAQVAMPVTQQPAR